MKRTIPYGHQDIDKKDIEAVISTLESDFITQGPRIDEFEQAIANFVDAGYCTAVSSGTAALHAACAVCGISKGDEVIVPTLSFVASANCVVYCGGKPVLCDVYKDTLTINVEDAERRINRKTRAIVAVDFAGHPADWSKLKRLCRKHRLTLIDDATHALGSRYHGKPVGSLADLSVFSFHPVKLITTGEGGVVATNNKNFLNKLIQFRNHGIERGQKIWQKYGGWFYDISTMGFNYRLTDMQASLGISQFKKIDSYIKKRRLIWQRYQKALKGNQLVQLPIEKDNCFSAWHIFPIRLNLEKMKKSRRQVFDEMRNAGIEVQVHYIPIHFLSFYRKRFGYKTGMFPVAEDYYKRALTLPLFPTLSQSRQYYIVRKLQEIVQ